MLDMFSKQLFRTMNFILSLLFYLCKRCFCYEEEVFIWRQLYPVGKAKTINYDRFFSSLGIKLEHPVRICDTWSRLLFVLVFQLLCFLLLCWSNMWQALFTSTKKTIWLHLTNVWCWHFSCHYADGSGVHTRSSDGGRRARRKVPSARWKCFRWIYRAGESDCLPLKIL